MKRDFNSTKQGTSRNSSSFIILIFHKESVPVCTMKLIHVWKGHKKLNGIYCSEGGELCAYN